MKTLFDVLKKSDMIALATSVSNIPNVRIVNYCFDEKRPGVLYFSSDRTNPKAKEFAENCQVAITTIPTGEIAHLRSHNAVVAESTLPSDQLKKLFIERVDGYQHAIEAVGEAMQFYEIQMKEAVIITGFGKPEIVNFE